MLLDPALQLPDPETDEAATITSVKMAKAAVAPSSRPRDHFGSRSISRPGAAL